MSQVYSEEALLRSEPKPDRQRKKSKEIKKEEDPEFVPKSEKTQKTRRKVNNNLIASDCDPEKKERRGRKPLHSDNEYLDKFINLNSLDKPLVCIDCTRCFEVHLDFGLHSKKHREDNLYFCHLCDYTEKSKTIFKNHILCHDEYQCKKCNKVFKNKRCAYKHWKTHSVQITVQCEVCGKNVRSAYLDTHKKMVHTEDASAMFQCTLCQKSYKNSTALKGHYSFNHKEFGIDTSVICDICGMRLSCKGKLGQHMRTHTGDKPFSCTVCSKKFISKDILTSHMRVHTGEKPYVCMYCGKKFAHGAPYRYHIKTHTGEKSCSCPLCGKGFISKANMRIHLKSCLFPVK